MSYSKTQMVAAAAAAIPVGAMGVHYGAPYVFTAVSAHVTVAAGTKAATALYVASSAAAAVGAIAAVAAVGWAVWKAAKWIGNRFPGAGKAVVKVASAVAVVADVVSAVGKAANNIPDTPSGLFDTPPTRGASIATPDAVTAYAGTPSASVDTTAMDVEMKSAKKFKDNAPTTGVADHFVSVQRISDIPKTAIAEAMEAAGMFTPAAH